MIFRKALLTIILLGLLSLFLLIIDYVYSHPSSWQVRWAWGHQPFTSQNFTSTDPSKRFPYAYDLMTNHILQNMNREEVRKILGEPDSYYITDTNYAYLINKSNGNNWILVVIFNESKLFDRVIIVRSCCENPIIARIKFFWLDVVANLLSLLPANAKANIPNECAEWFKKLRFQNREECHIRCLSIPKNLSNLQCDPFCKEFCQIAEDQNNSIPYEWNLIALYPGLTDEELKWVRSHPNEAKKAYFSSWEAATTCEKMFPGQPVGGTADACRHFYWAADLVHKIGYKSAAELLKAHESNKEQPLEEKEMDLFNNQKGLEFGKKLNDDGKEISKDVLLNEIRRKLNTLEIIKKDKI